MNMSWIQSIVDSIVGILFAPIENMFMEAFDMSFMLISTGTSSIFYNSTVTGILDIVSKFSFVVMVFTIPFLLKDIYMQADNIDFRQVIQAVIQGYLFSKISIIGGVSFFRYSFYILNLMGMNIDNTQIKANGFPVFGGPLMTFIIMLTIVIATIVFFIELIKSTSAMLIHLIASPLYVPYIVKGDTQKLSEWITMAVSIAVTYFIQYFVFYTAMYFFIQRNYILAMVFMSAAFGVKNTLRNFGFSSGSGGFRNIMGVSQSALYALRGLRGLV